ncbi:hypothetical protein O7632_30680 [Solwaraspora sp. WMMD406]|uniref:hypothetical protein n=1 Tax=Solwaraspora sp. WMMD406 TaxID=3016095 RepID=UPI0024176013|nr:hypothetical protein [Solwaraspora sp. WMMD406]MDG4768427.1 hypothetical protein [Solwaraspora sp. WMMD406]
MTPSTRGHRRFAVLITGAAAAGVLLLSGCGTGQIAETALKSASINGVNIDSPNGAVSLRNLSLPYSGTEGYPEGGSAPVEVAIYNNTAEPIAIRVSAVPATGDEPETLVSAESVVLGGSDDAEPSPDPDETPDPASPEPTEAPEQDSGREAIIELPANGWALYTADSDELLRVTGLSERVAAGYMVNLAFEFSDGSPALVVPAPVTVPLSPAPREPGEHEDEEH